MAMHDVSVVMVNYNAGSLLADSVAAALAQAGQVVVVDNASTDTSLALMEARFPGIPRLTVIRNSANTGFAAACNLGMRQCDSRYILFLNPDCVLGERAVSHMVATFATHPGTGMVGGLLLNEDGSEQGGGRRAVPTPWRSFVRATGLSYFANRWPKLFYDFHLHKQPLPAAPIQVEAISGALMLVSREALEDVGEWDDNYFLHCEDLDLCMRFRRNNWHILFDSGAPAIHKQGACSRSRPVFVEWHKHLGMVRFYRKFFHHQYPGLMMGVVTVGVWMRFALVAIAKLTEQAWQKVDAGARRETVRGTLPATMPPATVAERAEPPVQAARTVAVVGATSMVGSFLLPMLAARGGRVIAFSRNPPPPNAVQSGNIEWRDIHYLRDGGVEGEIGDWIWLAPIRILPEYLQSILDTGARHIVAVSTTSRFTKMYSSSEAERRFVGELSEAERLLQMRSERSSASWTILRPTLIYGHGMDRNVAVIARFIRRFRFFPIFGEASGLRQPVHARDVAAACQAALDSGRSVNRAYNISGGERLSYKMMVERIFEALAIRPRFLSMPLWTFAAGVAVLRILPPFRSWSVAMAERMNKDMIFEHDAADSDLGFSPQGFSLEKADLPN
ncbi:MAG: glycosyltransferase [Halothiobacillaceae bacterium]|nr:glycosyltransferase [Halothiobacillaceae bacterium]